MSYKKIFNLLSQITIPGPSSLLLPSRIQLWNTVYFNDKIAPALLYYPKQTTDMHILVLIKGKLSSAREQPGTSNTRSKVVKKICWRYTNIFWSWNPVLVSSLKPRSKDFLFFFFFWKHQKNWTWTCCLDSRSTFICKIVWLKWWRRILRGYILKMTFSGDTWTYLMCSASAEQDASPQCQFL